MGYNFDEIIERKNTASIKWNPDENDIGDILPMWVADMDFKSPPQVIEDLRKRVDHGIYGYFTLDDEFYQSIINWVKKRHGWEIKKEWIVLTPGVVTGLNTSINEFIDEGDKVIVQPPIYPPFYQVIKNKKALALDNKLIKEDGHYLMDFKDLEDKAKEASMLILCSPHNPTGRVWKREELEEVVRICEENDVLLVSDEIHSDLIMGGNKHIPIAMLSEKIMDRTISFIAPSKTFNLAGLSTSIAIIPNEMIRTRFKDNMEVHSLPGTNTFGKIALKSAYENGEEWLEALLSYVEGNMDFVVDYIAKYIPELSVEKPEGMYLMWLDFSGLDRDQEEIDNVLKREGKILLNDGSTYGQGGDGYFRLNIGCPRKTLEDGLARIKKAVEYIKNN